MRIVREQGKKYRAYSPEEFFKSSESPQRTFNLNEPKSKRSHTKDLTAETDQKLD
ncbi:MAG TPA: hypothetical protein VE439_08485 [Anaerolineae bacterium]|nr:hypothetical protein [Anaerolineae bacterium]